MAQCVFYVERFLAQVNVFHEVFVYALLFASFSADRIQNTVHRIHSLFSLDAIESTSAADTVMLCV